MLDDIRSSMPELPAARRERYVSQLRLSTYDAGVIVASGFDYFDRAIASRPGLDARRAASLYTEVALRAAKTDPELLAARDPGELGRVVELLGSGDLTAANAKEVYQRHLEGNAMDYIVGREIYSHLEKVLDRFEDVANEISGIVIDHA